MQIDKISHLEMDPLAEEEIKVVIEGITTIETIIGPTYRNRSRGRWNNHRSGDRSSNYQNYNRRGNTRLNYRQNAQWTFRNRSQSRNRNENYNNDYTRGRSRDRHANISVQWRREESRSQSNSRVSTNCDRVRCYRCREYNHFTSEYPNTPTDEEPDYDNTEPAPLQMITQNYCPIDSEGEVEYLNL